MLCDFWHLCVCSLVVLACVIDWGVCGCEIVVQSLACVFLFSCLLWAVCVFFFPPFCLFCKLVFIEGSLGHQGSESWPPRVLKDWDGGVA